MDSLSAVKPFQATRGTLSPTTQAPSQSAVRFGAASELFPETIDYRRFLVMTVTHPELLRSPRQYLRDALGKTRLTDIAQADGFPVSEQVGRLRELLRETADRTNKPFIMLTMDTADGLPAKVQRAVGKALHEYSQTDEGALYRVLPGSTAEWQTKEGLAVSDKLNSTLVHPLQINPPDTQQLLFDKLVGATRKPDVVKALKPQPLQQDVHTTLQAFASARRMEDASSFAPIYSEVGVSRFVYPDPTQPQADNTTRLPVQFMTTLTPHEQSRQDREPSAAPFDPAFLFHAGVTVSAKPPAGGTQPFDSPQPLRDELLAHMLTTVETQGAQWITLTSPSVLRSLQQDEQYLPLLDRMLIAN